MRPFDLSSMTAARSLVGAGRLSDATALIRTTLSGAPSPTAAPAPTPAPAPEMRDITPRARVPPPVAGPDADTTSRPAGAVVDRRTTCAAGTLDWKLHIPARLAPSTGLVVMLHGCTQDPDDFATGTGMNRLADRHGFVVVWPRQTMRANANKCWNWFEPGHQGQSGEVAVLAAVIRQAIAETGADPQRVFVAGLSAGGAMAANLALAYPDLVRGIGVHSGLCGNAANGMPAAFSAMRQGSALPVTPRRVPVIAFHGSADRTVAQINGRQVLGAVDAGEKPRQAVLTRGGRRTVRTVLTNEAGIRAEHWAVDGLGHAWSGGNPAGSFADPVGPDASAEMVRFFGLATG